MAELCTHKYCCIGFSAGVTYFYFLIIIVGVLWKEETTRCAGERKNNNGVEYPPRQNGYIRFHT